MFKFGNEKNTLDKTKLMNYMGTKYKHVEVINDIIRQSSKTHYCEPFLGSGAIFLNLDKSFDSYVLNDTSKDMMSFYKYKDLLTKEFIDGEIAKIVSLYDVTRKEDYYSYRDDYFNVQEDSPERVVSFWVAASVCMNNMVRFNQQGKFNQSFGDRSFNSANFISAMEKIRNYKNIKDFNTDVFNILDSLEDDKFLIFLDPPYIANEMGLTGGFNEESLSRLISYMENTNNDIVYTDTLNDLNDALKGFTKQKISDMLGTRPREGKEKAEEYVFYKIN